MRTFIAVDLTSETKGRISDLVHRLKFAAPRGIGWPAVADLHITLKFLGEIDEAGLPDIRNAVQAASAETPVFSVNVSGTGTFPSASRRPRVLWVGIKECPALQALQNRIVQRLEALGYPPEDRPWRPHLTIGRVKSAVVPNALLDRLAEYREAGFGDVPIQDVSVYKSILRPDGPEHTVLFRGALRP